MGHSAPKAKPAAAKKPAVLTTRPRLPLWLPALALVLVTIGLYWPVTSYDFVNYDDDMYVKDNPHVTSGLSVANASWAFRSDYAGNWHPVTWLSHMVDCQLFGLNPGGHHFTNALFHALNTALVFMLLRQMTGATWRSLAVAALFALHPLRVESVAWVSERKDVLSGFFGLLALMAYARYAVRGQRSFSHLPSSICYLLSLGSFALGLMSKPMLVTWPFVMLLLDYWPLRRMQNVPASDMDRAPRNTPPVSPVLRSSTAEGGRFTFHVSLLLEKLPFFALVLLGSVVTLLAQKHGGAVMAAASLSVSARVSNALISYGRYLEKVFWPTNLAVYYPHPGQWPPEKVGLAGGLILGISILLFVMRRRSPVLLVGWLWFLATLVPVIGLVQVGGQAMADRYTYLPSLGVLILAAWGACELTRVWRYQLAALSVAGGTAIVVCLALTRQQIGYWKENETLFGHALQVTVDNQIAHKSLGDALDKNGQTDQAIAHFKEAVRIKPGYADAHNNLGNALLKKGLSDEAISQFREAIRLQPEYPEAYNNIGNALIRKGRPGDAIPQYQEAIRLKPDDANTHYNLGNALLKNGQPDEAIRQYQEAIRLKPDSPAAYYNLGVVHGMKGQTDEAIRHFQEAIRLKPDYAEAHSNLGTAFFQQGRTSEAIREYQEALRLRPDFPTPGETWTSRSPPGPILRHRPAPPPTAE